MVVQVFRGRGVRNWRVRLVAENGRVLAVSEGYFSRWNAMRAAGRMFPGLQVRHVRGASPVDSGK
jgi:hypothetical protein